MTAVKITNAETSLGKLVVMKRARPSRGMTIKGTPVLHRSVGGISSVAPGLNPGMMATRSTCTNAPTQFFDRVSRWRVTTSGRNSTLHTDGSRKQGKHKKEGSRKEKK